MWRRFLIATFQPQPSFLCFCAVLAVLAGVSRSLSDRTSRTKVIDHVAAGLVSLVAGLIACLLAKAWLGGSRDELIAAISALAGWIGRILLDLLGGMAMRRLRKDMDDRHRKP